MISLQRKFGTALFSAVLALATTHLATAGEIDKKLSPAAKISVETAFGVQIQSSAPSKIPGLFELLTDRGIVYTDPAGEYVLANAALIETKTKQNLTAQRLESLSAYAFESFPTNDAIKIVRGKGTRKLVAFEDPNCGYCKKLEHTLDKVDDVTVYVFLVPVLGPDSSAKAKAIWCSTDRTKAWKEQMTSGVAPVVRQECETPLDRNLALFTKLHLRGTPSIYFPSGYHTPGAITAEEIEKQLSEAKKGDSVRP
jgi:thiol:disulfide interchange protein DsbC